MAEQEKVSLKAELDRAIGKYYIMQWYSTLCNVACMLLDDSTYSREAATRDIIKVMRQMEDKISA